MNNIAYFSRALTMNIELSRRTFSTQHFLQFQFVKKTEIVFPNQTSSGEAACDRRSSFGRHPSVVRCHSFGGDHHIDGSLFDTPPTIYFRWLSFLANYPCGATNYRRKLLHHQPALEGWRLAREAGSTGQSRWRNRPAQ